MDRRARRPKPTPRRRPARRGAARRSARSRLPVLEQRHLDVIGLGLVALAALLALVFYLGWAGGRLGEALADGLVWLLGGAAYLVPVGVFGVGAVLVLRPMLPTVRPLRSGAVCLLLAFVVGLAAGTFGLGPEQPPRSGPLADPAQFRHHGGAAGEVLLLALRTLIGQVGAHIVVVFLLLAGVVLLTGGSIASALQATRQGVSATTQRVRRSTTDFAAVVTRRTPRAEEEAATDVDGPVAGGREVGLPPEPAAGGLDAHPDPVTIEAEEPPEVEPVVRATHVEAPSLDAARRYPDLFESADAPPIEEEPPEADPDDEPPADVEEPEVSLTADEDPGHEHSPDALTPMGRLRSSVTQAEGFAYRLPSSEVLERSRSPARVDTRAEERTGGQLIEALGHFGVDAQVVGTVSGPHVTRYEIRLSPGTKMSKVAQLKDDIAYALAATDVRILAPIPGKRAVGVEVPNSVRRVVHLGDVFQAPPSGWSPLSVWLGKDIAGKAIGTDIAKQPHLLVAGTTGSGKSGSVNAMLASILLRATPNEVRLVLVDPKQVELGLYESIPHLLTPVVTNPRAAANVLGNLIREMEERYGIMSLARTRNLVELNRLRESRGERPLPYILCVIDELADLMMVAPGEVEDAIIRLAQKSRAVGIHLLLATQRPSADIITGMIKANVPARIAFAVSSQTDSRVILDQNGAESLLGQGDMLFRPASESRSARIQGAFVGEDEIERLTDFWRSQGEPELQEELLEAVESDDEEAAEADYDRDADDLLADAVATVVQMGSASTSMLQRRLRVGYTRAGRLIDMMERRGVISGYEGSKARQVLVSESDLPRVLAALEEPAATASEAAS
jgi:S-DNA-T family DNA segregation ATPase FtsK/SpoIIIE